MIVTLSLLVALFLVFSIYNEVKLTKTRKLKDSFEFDNKILQREKDNLVKRIKSADSSECSLRERCKELEEELDKSQSRFKELIYVLNDRDSADMLKHLINCHEMLVIEDQEDD